MGYCSISDLKIQCDEKILIDFSNDDNLKIQPKEVDSNVLNAFIEQISSRIDGYLRGSGYTLPLQIVPPALVSCACNMVICLLIKRKGRSRDFPEFFEANKEENEYLQKLKEGKVYFDTTVGEVSKGSRPAAVTMTGGIDLPAFWN